MRCVIVVATLLSSAPAFATEYEIAHDPSTGSHVWAEYVAGNLILRTDGPPTTLTLFQFDVNHNGRVDARYDRQYGFLDSGRLCSDFLLSEDSSTPCGVAPSAGQGSVRYASGRRTSRITLPAAEVSNTARRFTIRSSIWNTRTKSYYRETVEFRPGAPVAVMKKPVPKVAAASSSASNSLDALAADLDRRLKVIPLAFDVFMNDAPGSPITSLSTKGCVTTLTTQAWGKATINWGGMGTKPMRAFPQTVGTRNSAGTMVSFDVPGLSPNASFSQLLNDKRYEPQFKAMEDAALRLWKACGGT